MWQVAGMNDRAMLIVFVALSLASVCLLALARFGVKADEANFRP